jgi:PKHD-type hydroxylase
MEYKQSTGHYWDMGPSFVHWENAFSNEELDILQAEAKKSQDEAMVGDETPGGAVKPETRVTKISWLNPEEFRWAYDRVVEVIKRVNYYYYNYDLTDFQMMQLANYDATQNGKYEWHADTGDGFARKLSFALQLSDPQEYEGGDFEVMHPGCAETLQCPKRRGDMIIFPSYRVHRVQPVTKGSRQSMVAWINGPRFR